MATPVAHEAPQFGEVQIGSSAEYANMAPGFVIEEYGVHGWAIPAWEERGLTGLEGVFPTKEAAALALAEA